MELCFFKMVNREEALGRSGEFFLYLRSAVAKRTIMAVEKVEGLHWL
jgi:hypothetical protein